MKFLFPSRTADFFTQVEVPQTTVLVTVGRLFLTGQMKLLLHNSTIFYVYIYIYTHTYDIYI